MDDDKFKYSDPWDDIQTAREAFCPKDGEYPESSKIIDTLQCNKCHWTVGLLFVHPHNCIEELGYLFVACPACGHEFKKVSLYKPRDLERLAKSCNTTVRWEQITDPKLAEKILFG